MNILMHLIFFLEDSQTKYLNALLDNLGKNLRKSNA